MADSDAALRSTAWSSVVLGVALASAQAAWFALNDDKTGRSVTDAGYVVLTGLAVLGWVLVVACGATSIRTGRPPGRGLATAAAACGAIAAIVAIALLVATSGVDNRSDAFDDVLLQAWPLLPLLLLAGDWVRRSRTRAALPV